MLVLHVLGYQRELTYKRSDGSYSAFGNGDSEGNMWWVLSFNMLFCYSEIFNTLLCSKIMVKIYFL